MKNLKPTRVSQVLAAVLCMATWGTSQAYTFRVPVPGLAVQSTSSPPPATPAVSAVSPSSLSFGLTDVGTYSAGQTVTVSNTGGSPLTVSGATVGTANFAVSTNNCTSVAAGASCAIDVTFQPAATGTLTDTLTVQTSAGTQTVSLSGASKNPGPSDPSWAQVASLFTLDTNTADVSSRNSGSLTLSGAATLSSASPMFGAGSLYLPGPNNVNNYGILSNYSLGFGPGQDLTIEFWAKPTAYASSATPQFSALVGQWPSDLPGEWLIGLDTSGHLLVDVSSFSSTITFMTTTATVPLNAWSAIALVRSANTFTLYLNGTAVATRTFSGATVGMSSTPLILGNYGYAKTYGSWNAAYSGYLDELRITGVARYTANYTPASAAFPTQ